MIVVARWSLVGLAIMLAPVYALWVAGGWVADRMERRRHDRIVRGER